MAKGFALGVLFVVVAGLAGGWLAVRLGLIPANADAAPSKLETWAAHTSLRATLRREASKAPVPLAADEKNLLAGVRLYAANCAICHGAADGKASNVANGLYQGPPQFASDGVEDDPPGEIHWYIQHGIRMTGMPTFASSLTPDQLWQLTLFLKNMNKLPLSVQKAWKGVPSQGASR